MSEDNHKSGYLWMVGMLISQNTLRNVVNEVMVLTSEDSERLNGKTDKCVK